MPDPLRFLLVDDNPEDRMLVARELRRHFEGATILEASNPQQLREHLDNFNFDVTITDFQLQWTDGITVTRELKARSRFLPVIMFTATGTQEIAVEAMKAGLDDYVIKSPKHYARLPAAVRSAIEHCALARRASDLAEERERLLIAERVARSEAVRANRIKDNILATVSHELRTPMTSILGWMRMLRSGALKPAQIDQALEVIDRNAQLQARLIDDLLDLSRMLRGQLSLETHHVDMASIVEMVIESARPDSSARNLRIETMIDGVPLVSADPTRLQQIVWNILSNAVKFTPNGGRITVELKHTPPNVELRVSDTGVGIAPDFLPHVFDGFRQEESSTTRRYGGMGLGLAIVHHLVKLHGGTVIIRSDGPGKGTVCSVTLPAASSNRSTA